jgi:hypothetical protein
MRNVIFIVIASLCFCSCIKKYDCTCTPSANITNNQASITEVMQLSDNSKTSAKRRCEEYKEKLRVNNYVYDCSLK